MTYSANLWLFLTLLFGIVVIPGMDMLFVLTNALTGGRRAGLAATAGIMVGGAAHTLFGALGVSLIVGLAPRVFTVLLYAGAAYMAWIGLTLLRSSISLGTVDGPGARSHWIAFRQGAVTCLLNPKAYLFVLAVYPQFLLPRYGAIWAQALVMGLMTVLVQLAVYGGLALAADGARTVLVASPRVTAWIGRGAGLLFVLVAAATALRASL
ncbi:LysE family translocator [Microvirga thermotolerans]|uniref:LysE family translocator n=1 Tax=Microvirga thermotolerans TaxID=2651334 RepID=A0A5P9K2E0_9HYPH|nr:LysE family translocator [Microvirga thermotolerans]QFU16374.1 LysE family translocator [Microvirga thermotolerans]